MKNYIDLKIIIENKLEKMNINGYKINFEVKENNPILKIKAEEEIFEKIIEIIDNLNLKYFLEINEWYILKIDEKSFIEFQKSIIKNAKIKWVIEIISADYPYSCDSDESDIEFDIQRYYFDTEEEAMIEYFNLTNYKNEYYKRTICLAPKKILYFDI